MSQSPDISFGPSGPQVPDTSTVLAWVQGRFREAFGPDLNLDQSTPQGQLITTLTACITARNAALLHLSQMFDPDTASGVFQDALGRIYFLNRQAAAPSVAQCLCVGLPGTLIPGTDTSNSPALAQDASGVQWQCTRTGTIPESGSVTLPFASLETGPVACPAQSITTIVSVIPGWDTVTNPEAGVVGRSTEGRAAFEARRRQSVALNGLGPVAAIYSRVAAVDGVLDARVEQNVTDVPIMIGKVQLKPHSVYVTVVGGEDAAVAEAIARSKSAGSDMNGNTSYTVTDANSGAQQVITFERPDSLRLGVRVTLAETDTTPADIIDRIKAAIVANFTGADGSVAVGIGDTLYASRFYCVVLGVGVTDLLAVELAILSGSDPAWGVSVSSEINELLTLAADDVTVIVREQ